MHSSRHRTSKKLCDSISRIPRSSNRLCFHLSTWERLQSRGRQESNQERAGTRAPGSDRPALREYRAGPGTAAPVLRLCNHHSPHVPPLPPPPHPGAAVGHSTLRVGQGDELQPRPQCSRGSVGGRALTRGPGLHSTRSKLTAKLARSSRGAVGRTARVLSAPGGGRPLCREPHWARTSAWRRRPSKPRRVQPGPRAQRPVVCIPPPAATPACAGSRFSSPETPGFGARSPRPAPPLVRSARGRPRSEPGVHRGERPRGACSTAGGTVWGTVLEFRAGCCACYSCAEFYWMLSARKGETFAYPPPPKKGSKGGGEVTYGERDTSPPSRRHASL